MPEKEHERQPRAPATIPFHALKLGQDGSWTVYKCFIPEQHDDGEDAEFFLNLNEETGAGELRCADPAYAPVLIDVFRHAMQDEPPPSTPVDSMNPVGGSKGTAASS